MVSKIPTLPEHVHYKDHILEQHPHLHPDITDEGDYTRMLVDTYLDFSSIQNSILVSQAEQAHQSPHVFDATLENPIYYPGASGFFDLSESGTAFRNSFLEEKLKKKREKRKSAELEGELDDLIAESIKRAKTDVFVGRVLVDAPVDVPTLLRPDELKNDKEEKTKEEVEREMLSVVCDYWKEGSNLLPNLPGSVRDWDFSRPQSLIGVGLSNRIEFNEREILPTDSASCSDESAFACDSDEEDDVLMHLDTDTSTHPDHTSAHDTDFQRWLQGINTCHNDHIARRSFSDYSDNESVRSNDSDTPLLYGSPELSYTDIRSPYDSEDEEEEDVAGSGCLEQAFEYVESVMGGVSRIVRNCLD